MKSEVVILSLALLAVAAAAPARAHDLWLEPAAAGWRLQYGHRPGGHGGASTLPLPPERILAATALTAAGDTLGLPLAEARAGEWPASAPALFVITSSGVWTKSTQGTRNLPPAQVEHPLASWRSVESVKGIARWLPALARPLTLSLELVPASDPFQVAVGEKLTLIATRGGLPVAGVTVAYAGEPRGVTGADGKVNIRLREPGLQHLQASLETPLTDGEADTLIETTALDFLLPAAGR
jgi:nickel transport protein